MAPSRRRRSSRSPATRGQVTRELPLPLEAANAMLAEYKGKMHTVKKQELKLEDGTSITIARVKVPTPKGISGHLIRRFDTEAISGSSLFKVAYPAASDDAERAEMDYLVKRYNTRRAGDEDDLGNGKLTGVWIPVEDAPTLIKEYELTRFAAELLAFDPPADSPAESITTPSAPTPGRRVSKSPAPPTSAARSKRSRVMSPVEAVPMPSLSAPASSISTRSQSATSNTAATTTPSKPRSSRKSVAGGEKTPAKSSSVTAAAKREEREPAATGGIQVTQEVTTDSLTGEIIEETKVTFTGADADAITGGADAGLIGSDEQAREAAENARKLIESLKEEGVLQNGSSKRAREVDNDEEEGEDDDIEVDENAQPRNSVLKRMFGAKKDRTIKSSRKQPRTELGELQVMQSPDGAHVLVAQTQQPLPAAGRRRYIAMAGMVVVGAATAAAPYFFS